MRETKENVELAKKQYHDKFYGQQISDFGMVNGYVDYQCLANCGDCIMCNSFGDGYFTLELVNGDDYDEANERDVEICSWYIISEQLFDILKRYTSEIVYYYKPLDLYIWGITHWGTNWDHVLTQIPLERKEEII